MCSNLKYPFELQRIERIMACTNINSGLPSFYRILLLLQGRSMKGEHFWTCIKTWTACHKEQEDDEVVNRTLSTMLRVVLKKNIKMWEECLPHVEFAYNHSLHSTTKMCPFEMIYGFLSRALIDLMPVFF
jgi:hypothetical protein